MLILSGKLENPGNNISPTQNYVVVNYSQEDKVTPFPFCDKPDAKVAETIDLYSY